MKNFTFQSTLVASVRVSANTRADAEQKIRAAVASSDATFGMLDGAPLVVPVDIEGALDLIEAKDNLPR